MDASFVQQLNKSLWDANTRCLKQNKINLVTSDEDENETEVDLNACETDSVKSENLLDYAVFTTPIKDNTINKNVDTSENDNLGVSTDDLICITCKKHCTTLELVGECCKPTDTIHNLCINKIESLALASVDGPESMASIKTITSTDLEDSNAKTEAHVKGSKIPLHSVRKKKNGILFKKSKLMLKKYQNMKKTGDSPKTHNQCPVCYMTYESKQLLLRHCKGKHGIDLPNNFACRMCYGTFKSKNWLKNHYMKKHNCKGSAIDDLCGNQLFKCPECLVWFKEFGKYQTHLEMVHLKTIVVDNVAFKQCTLCETKYAYGETFKVIFEHFFKHFTENLSSNDSVQASTTTSFIENEAGIVDSGSIENESICENVAENLDTNCMDVDSANQDIENFIENVPGASTSLINKPQNGDVLMLSKNKPLNGDVVTLPKNMPTTSSSELNQVMQQYFMNAEYNVQVPAEMASLNPIDGLFQIAVDQLEKQDVSKVTNNTVNAVQNLQQNYELIKQQFLDNNNHESLTSELNLDDEIKQGSNGSIDQSYFDAVMGETEEKKSDDVDSLKNFAEEFKIEDTTIKLEDASGASEVVKDLEAQIFKDSPMKSDISYFSAIKNSPLSMVPTPIKNESSNEVNADSNCNENLETDNIMSKSVVRNIFHASQDLIENNISMGISSIKQDEDDDMKSIIMISDSSDTETEFDDVTSIQRKMPVLSPQIPLPKKNPKQSVEDISLVEENNLPFTKDNINNLFDLLSVDKSVVITLQISKNDSEIIIKRKLSPPLVTKELQVSLKRLTEAQIKFYSNKPERSKKLMKATAKKSTTPYYKHSAIAGNSKELEETNASKKPASFSKHLGTKIKHKAALCSKELQETNCKKKHSPSKQLVETSLKNKSNLHSKSEETNANKKNASPKQLRSMQVEETNVNKKKASPSKQLEETSAKKKKASPLKEWLETYVKNKDGSYSKKLVEIIAASKQLVETKSILKSPPITKSDVFAYKCPYCFFKSALLRAVKMHVIRDHKKAENGSFKRIIRLKNEEPDLKIKTKKFVPAPPSTDSSDTSNDGFTENIVEPISNPPTDSSDTSNDGYTKNSRRECTLRSLHKQPERDSQTPEIVAAEEKVVRDRVFKCLDCGTLGLSSHVLKAHVRKSHPHLSAAKKNFVSIYSKPGAIKKCQFCRFKTLDKKVYIAHLIKSHTDDQTKVISQSAQTPITPKPKRGRKPKQSKLTANKNQLKSKKQTTPISATSKTQTAATSNVISNKTSMSIISNKTPVTTISKTQMAAATSKTQTAAASSKSQIAATSKAPIDATSKLPTSPSPKALIAAALIPIMYGCIECHFESSKYETVHGHMTSTHDSSSGKYKFKPINPLKVFDGNNYVCELCPSTFTMVFNLRRHYVTLHAPDPAMEGMVCKCTLCTFEIQSLTGLREHIANAHPPTKKATKKRAAAIRATIKIENTASDDPPAAVTKSKPKQDSLEYVQYRCLHCAYRSKELEIVEKHMVVLHSEKLTGDPRQVPVDSLFDGFGYNCNICAARCDTYKIMRQHWMSKHGDNASTALGVCNFCDYETKSLGSLRKHIALKHLKNHVNNN